MTSFEGRANAASSTVHLRSDRRHHCGLAARFQVGQRAAAAAGKAQRDAAHGPRRLLWRGLPARRRARQRLDLSREGWPWRWRRVGGFTSGTAIWVASRVAIRRRGVAIDAASRAACVALGALDARREHSEGAQGGGLSAAGGSRCCRLVFAGELFELGGGRGRRECNAQLAGGHPRRKGDGEHGQAQRVGQHGAPVVPLGHVAQRAPDDRTARDGLSKALRVLADKLLHHPSHGQQRLPGAVCVAFGAHGD